MKVLAILLFLVCSSLSAQYYVVIAKNGNGVVIGVPMDYSPGEAFFDLITVHGYKVSTNAAGLIPDTTITFYESNDCTGQEYVRTWLNLAPRLEQVTNPDYSPRKIVLLPPLQAGVELTINSLKNAPNCQPYENPIQEVVLPIEQVLVDDPTQLGLQWSETLESWIFPPPVIFEIVDPQLISRSGFENLPEFPTNP